MTEREELLNAIDVAVNEMHEALSQFKWCIDEIRTTPIAESSAIALLKRIAPVLNKAIEEGAFKNTVAPNAPKKLLRQVHDLLDRE